MSEDKWFKRWGREMPFGPWSYADVEEMMKEMEKDFMDPRDVEKDVPKDLAREKRAPNRSSIKEIGPIVYGYSVMPGHPGEWKEPLEEARVPLVDVVEGENEVRVIAELPGVKKEDVKLTAGETNLKISVDTPMRKYRKDIALPGSVELERSESSFNNGVLEVTFPKRKGRSSSVRIAVD